VSQVVTAADLQPYGWCCEGCNRDFHEGDVVFGEWTGMVDDLPLESNFVCLDCKEKQL